VYEEEIGDLSLDQRERLLHCPWPNLATSRLCELAAAPLAAARDRLDEILHSKGLPVVKESGVRSQESGARGQSSEVSPQPTNQGGHPAMNEATTLLEPPAPIKSLLERIEEEIWENQPGPEEFERHPKTRVVTVRMPAVLHERLRDLKLRRGLSMNRLCVSALEYAADLLGPKSGPENASTAQPKEPVHVA